MDPIEHKLHAARLSPPSRDLDARIAAAAAAAREAHAARRPIFVRSWFPATLAATGLAAVVLVAFRLGSMPSGTTPRFSAPGAETAPVVCFFEPQGRLQDLLLGPGSASGPTSDVIFQVTALPEISATPSTP